MAPAIKDEQELNQILEAFPKEKRLDMREFFRPHLSFYLTT